MAENQIRTEVLKQVTDTMECCICTELFTDPRMLPCLHTFCFECIQQTGLLSGKRPGDAMPCPVCRETFKVPKDGFIGLQKNFFVERLVGILSTSKRAETFCGVCSGEGIGAAVKPLASVYCVECLENFCENCQECHQLNRTFSNHRIVHVGSQSHREVLLRNEETAVNYCGIHDNERLNLFCFDCRRVSCKVCASAEHSGHNCIHNVKAAAKFEKEIDDEVDELSVWTKMVVDRRQLLKQEVATFNANVEAVEKGVQDRCAELKQLLDEHTATLLEELNLTKETKLRELKTEDETLETNLNAVSSFKKYCSELKFSAQEAGHVVDILHLRASEIKKQHYGETSVQRLLLKKFDIKSVLDGNENIVGKIENCRVAIRGSIDTVSHSLYGITRLQNSIYALSQRPNSVLVFDDAAPFALRQSISLGCLQEPCDMAGCQVANCLYIADSGKNSVWKVSTDDNHGVNCWLTEEKYIATLSVSSVGQVAVLRKGQKCSLTIYSDDATVIHYLLLVGELSNALHAVQKMSGNFVISFGAGRQFGVCEITRSGNVVQRLSVDDETQRMKYPCHLACGLDDWIMVADFYNDRVILLDPELKFATEILSRQHEELRFPWRLCYNESCKQLLVVHGGIRVSHGRKQFAVCGLLVV